jgi:hypothetical protein
MWMLEEPLATEKQGKPIRFAKMVPIGPMSSAEPEEWATFETKEQALRSPAVAHMLTCYEPIEVCENCNGTGRYVQPATPVEGEHDEECWECNGTGKKATDA